MRGIILMLGLSVIAAVPGHAQSNVMATKLIRDAEPCGMLKTTQKVLGVEVQVGIDKFKNLAVHAVQIDVKDDNVSALLDLTLTCRTSDSAMIKGDASARLAVSMQASLDGCQISQLDATVKQTGGSLGAVINAFRGSIENELRESAKDEFLKACQTLQP